MKAAYLSLPTEEVLDEVHGALGERREVHLPLLCEHIVDVQLALDPALELAPGHCYLPWLSLGLVVATKTATTSSIFLVL
jgi:hypothetical protein